MINIKELVAAVEQIAEEKGISKDKALEAVEAALAAAYKKEYRKRSEVVRSRLNTKTGNIEFSQVKTVVLPEEVRIVEDDEEGGVPVPEVKEGETLLPRYNPDRHIFLEEAKDIRPSISAGDEIEFPLESHADFGRIAAQTAKQVILQGLREAEKDSIRAEFVNKEGEIVSGVVQRFERGNVYVDIGRAVGVMFSNESVPGEHYRVGQRMKFLILAVQDEDKKRPGIILSRGNPAFVKKLFELEVPEISEGMVEIRAIAREPGSRTKIAVYSHQDGVDPIGAVVGQRGTRVMAVTNELGNEKIDVMEWSDDVEKFVANALSPAKVKLVEIMPRREARVLVQEDQLSLAIGKSGQNVRLAAKLTGLKIDVRSQSRPDEMQDEGVAEAAKPTDDSGNGGDGDSDKMEDEKTEEN